MSGCAIGLGQHSQVFPSVQANIPAPYHTLHGLVPVPLLSVGSGREIRRPSEVWDTQFVPRGKRPGMPSSGVKRGTSSASWTIGRGRLGTLRLLTLFPSPPSFGAKWRHVRPVRQLDPDGFPELEPPPTASSYCDWRGKARAHHVVPGPCGLAGKAVLYETVTIRKVTEWECHGGRTGKRDKAEGLGEAPHVSLFSTRAGLVEREY
ncbi:hypothetical protein DPEC_G00308500 [Dallia pectoralis]|uniref:Uncharacterized protein n=1 Tax=Dallia pectoralis TaxID=75939 RepID=A0ACC2FEQ0_DALPE|nr:hypothetical protein DPEC_G00308500 [Dallia pectoralis]